MADELRRRAEKIARAKAARMPENLDGLSPEETRQLLHELRVHQVELEMQNEELRRVQEQLEVSRARYFDLYDLAPVGYVTLSEKGMILEANLTIVTLLGVTRGALVKQPLTRFIVREDQDIHYRHRKQLLETGAPQAYEVRMARRGTGPFWARLEAIIAQDAGGLPLCRVAVSDITRRICAEQEVKILSARLLEAQEEERRRIARDLHDGFGGLLSAIKYKFEAAQGPQEVEEVIPFLQQGIEECRRIQMNLRPSLLDDLGLLATLSWLTREFEKRSPGLRVEKQFEIEEGEIPPALENGDFQDDPGGLEQYLQAQRERLGAPIPAELQWYTAVGRSGLRSGVRG